jgi:hypothetical protein
MQIILDLTGSGSRTMVEGGTLKFQFGSKIVSGYFKVPGSSFLPFKK